LRADNTASQLANKQHPVAFGNGISRDSCRKDTSYSNKVGNAVGSQEVCEMWKNQFNKLYNALNDDGRPMREFYYKLHSSANNNQHRIITVAEVSAAIACQKEKRVQV